ncbi:MAG: hypothetical protein ACRYGI_11530 [Janthinobacterium lividum]
MTARLERPEGFEIGAMYRVPWSPNPHRLEAINPQYCQLHGEHIGWTLQLRKRRMSERQPWGSISNAAADTAGIERWPS